MIYPLPRRKTGLQTANNYLLTVIAILAIFPGGRQTMELSGQDNDRNRHLGTKREPPELVEELLNERCLECHSGDTKEGGIDLEELLEGFSPDRDWKVWSLVDSVITSRKMPPADEDPLSNEQLGRMADWFEAEFVKPGGMQVAGPHLARRLTREELQNTLEDILHIEMRAAVTNSRLHVIPDTVVEKFFPPGIRGESGFSNDAITLGKEPVDIQKLARCYSLLIARLESNREAYRMVLGRETIPDSIAVDEIREILADFGRVAFRRNLTSEELTTYTDVYAKRRTQRSASDSLRSSVLAILLSPQFLYRIESPVDTEKFRSGQQKVVGVELATRLSYFLWSAPPDQELAELAAAGKLAQPNVFRQQIRRMLRDPKRIALAENLGGEWFDYKLLRQKSAVNQRSDKMAGFYRTQYEEAILFFDSLLRFDQSVFRLVDADWTFLNRHQTNIYRLQTVTKTMETPSSLPPINLHFRNEIQQVEEGNYEYKHQALTLVGLQDPSRGGFLTMGPTLSVTSTPNRTSPIRRGVWVIERILGKHFKQPENVPDLEASRKKAKKQNLKLTANEILKIHSSQVGCASCHRFIDPIGFGLEVYDQIGVERAGQLTVEAGEKLNWTANQVPPNYQERSWVLTKPLVGGSKTLVQFQRKSGAHRLDIRDVRLTSGKLEILDSHVGSTGSSHRDNIWFFPIPKGEPLSPWTLTARVRGSGGTDSNGVITVAGPDDQEPGFQMPNGREFRQPAELKSILLTDFGEQFIDNAIRRVLAYALGRSVLPVDRPALEKIKEQLRQQDHKFLALIEAVAMSYPFLHKTSR